MGLLEFYCEHNDCKRAVTKVSWSRWWLSKECQELAPPCRANKHMDHRVQVVGEVRGGEKDLSGISCLGWVWVFQPESHQSLLRFFLL